MAIVSYKVTNSVKFVVIKMEYSTGLVSVIT